LKPNEAYWIELYKSGKIEIDFETGLVYSWLVCRSTIIKKDKRIIGSSPKPGWYVYLSAGPTRKERYNILAHRMIWAVANGEIPEGMEINHINGVKNDNKLCNLELVTKSQNELHKYRVLGKKCGISCGENSGASKLTWNDVQDIRWLWNEGVHNYSSIGREFGIVRTQVKNIITGISWNEKHGEALKL
jgi:hypothetical protein